MKRTDLIPGTEYAVGTYKGSSVVRAKFIGVGEREQRRGYYGLKTVTPLIFKFHGEADEYNQRRFGLESDGTFELEDARNVTEEWASHAARIERERARRVERDSQREANREAVERWNAATGMKHELYTLRWGADGDHIRVSCADLDALLAKMNLTTTT